MNTTFKAILDDKLLKIDALQKVKTYIDTNGLKNINAPSIEKLKAGTGLYLYIKKQYAIQLEIRYNIPQNEYISIYCYDSEWSRSKGTNIYTYNPEKLNEGLISYIDNLNKEVEKIKQNIKDEAKIIKKLEKMHALYAELHYDNVNSEYMRELAKDYKYYPFSKIFN